MLRDISFSLHKGEVLSIIGPSGSGKSTLLRCITQLERVDGGEIDICGKRMVWTTDGAVTYADKESLRHIRLQCGLVFQNFNLFPICLFSATLPRRNGSFSEKARKRRGKRQWSFWEKWD